VVSLGIERIALVLLAMSAATTVSYLVLNYALLRTNVHSPVLLVLPVPVALGTGAALAAALAIRQLGRFSR
jgi:hypothetical protein